MSTAFRLVIVVFFAGLAGWWFLPNVGPQADGAALATVIVPDLSADATLGEALFNDNCGSCHGSNAAGRDGLGPPLVHKIYEPSHHGDQAFFLAARNGVKAHHWSFGNMPPVVGVRPEQVEMIVGYVRTLQRANGIE